MSRHKLALVSLLALLALGLLLRSLLLRPNGFRATQVSDGSGFPCTVYVKGMNVRRVISVGSVSAHNVTLPPIPRISWRTSNLNPSVEIVNARAGRYWILDPARKTYQEMRPSADSLHDLSEALRGVGPLGLEESQTRQVGTEVVGGYPCEKIVTEGKDGTVTEWYSPQLDFDIRAEMTLIIDSQGFSSRTEYKIKECYLPDSLFELPRGYRKVPGPAVGPAVP